ncbi:hypothetical protein C8D96_1859 [Kushneria marisflavi]|nr:hypothetical protein C8D96_1859 [Kushneria marisflavi]
MIDETKLDAYRLDTGPFRGIDLVCSKIFFFLKIMIAVSINAVAQGQFGHILKQNRSITGDTPVIVKNDGLYPAHTIVMNLPGTVDILALATRSALVLQGQSRRRTAGVDRVGL